MIVHGARLATEHLLTLGHRRIAHVAGPAGHSPSADRLAGYRAALAEAGIPFDPALVVSGTGRPAAGEQALPQLLALRRPAHCGLLLQRHDRHRSAGRRACGGLTCRDDLAVVGFDDIPFATYVSPPLTTIAQPKFEMGQRRCRWPWR